MGQFWTFLTQVHSLAGPVTMLLYPLYASVVAIESPSKEDDEQWLAYWILYSFLTLAEMVLEPVLQWIPIWYSVKLVFVLWLVLPQFKGAAYLYVKFVREQIKNRQNIHHQEKISSSSSSNISSAISKSSPNGKSPSGKTKKKFVDFILPKKGEHEAR